MPFRPFLYITLSLVLGIIIGRLYNSLHYMCVFTGLFTLVFISFILRKPAFLLLGFVFIGMLSYKNYNKISTDHFQHILIKNSYYEALLLSQGKTSEKHFTQFKAVIKKSFNDSISFETSGYALLYLKNAASLPPNRTILFKAKFDTLKPSTNPYAFNYAKYLKNKRIYRQSFVKKFKVIPSPYWNFEAFFNKIKVNVAQKITTALGAYEETAVAKALLIGDKNELSYKIKNNYARTGSIHLLAISGLHTATIYLILYYLLFFFQLCPGGKAIQIILSLLLLWFYAGITGFSASVFRAGLMITLVQLCVLFQRKKMLIHILFLSAFLQLLICPNLLFDVGFQLSYAAVLSIFLFFPLFKNHFHFRFKLFQYYYHAILITLLATLGTLPFSLYYFNFFPTLFLLSNLVITPLFGWLMVIGFIMLLLLITSISFPLMNTLFFGMIHFMNLFIEWIFSLGMQINDIYFSEVQVVLLFCIILTLYFFLRLKKSFYLYMILGFIFLMQGFYFYKKTAHYNESELIIFDYRKNSIIGIKNGFELTLFSEKKLSNKEKKYLIEPYQSHNFIYHTNYYPLDSAVNSHHYLKTKNIIHWANKTLLINPPVKTSAKVDYIFISNPKLLSKWNQKNVITTCYEKTGIKYYTYKTGAFKLKCLF